MRPSANAVLDPATGEMLEYRQLLKTKQQPTWENSLSVELARLASGRSKDATPRTNTIEWIHPHQIPSNKKPTYVSICATYRPQKADPYRVRCTLGGNLITYNGPTSTAVASLPVIKILINSVLSTPNAKICSYDTSYLSEPKARSRAGGYYYLSSKPNLPILANDPAPPLNAPIAVKSKIIDAVMSSASEAETGAGFYNAKELLSLRQALEDLGHPQGPTPIQFDNKSATQILKEEVTQKRS